jgi:hypothetical protein
MSQTVHFTEDLSQSRPISSINFKVDQASYWDYLNHFAARMKKRSDSPA